MADVARHARAQQHTVAPTPAPVTPAPVRHKPAPKPPAPTYRTASGALTGGASGPWSVGGTTFSLAGLAIGSADYDDDHATESIAAELAGLLDRSARVTVTYQVGTSPVRITRLAVVSLAPVPADPTPSAAVASASATS